MYVKLKWQHYGLWCASPPLWSSRTEWQSCVRHWYVYYVSLFPEKLPEKEDKNETKWNICKRIHWIWIELFNSVLRLGESCKWTRRDITFTSQTELRVTHKQIHTYHCEYVRRTLKMKPRIELRNCIAKIRFEECGASRLTDNWGSVTRQQRFNSISRIFQPVGFEYLAKFISHIVNQFRAFHSITHYEPDKKTLTPNISSASALSTRTQSISWQSWFVLHPSNCEKIRNGKNKYAHMPNLPGAVGVYICLYIQTDADVYSRAS